MKSVLIKSVITLSIIYFIYIHFLSYPRAKQLIYSYLNPSTQIDGNGSYAVSKIEIDSICYHGFSAHIHYRLTATYSNGSIRNFPERHYENEPSSHQVALGAFGWRNQ